jgi:tRNA(adenine34) deaminase
MKARRERVSNFSFPASGEKECNAAKRVLCAAKLFYSSPNRIEEARLMTHTSDHCHTHVTGQPSQLHSRRSIVVALASAAAASSGPVLAKSDASPEDERFMRMALDEARQGDYAFGCVITRNDEVIALGRNLGKTNDDPTAHGEMVAIRRCLADHGSAALRGATLYTSGEPCAMCMGAIVWCGIGRLVFAASVPQIGSLTNQIMITSTEVAARAKWDPVKITGGVLADEAMRLFGK